MTKTNRRTKPATNAHLTNTATERPSVPPQPLPRKMKLKGLGRGGSAQSAASAPANTAVTSQCHTPPRPGSKQALVVGLLVRQQGASLAEMMEATGWLPHSTRAALTGLRQRGCIIERSTSTDGSSTYRITNAAPAAPDGETA
jgi:hypothetical protein